MSELRDQVRDRYAAAANAVERGMAADDTTAQACCDPAEGYGLRFYDITQRQELPDQAVLASLGCGNPTMVADLREGESVLDLGSGGGIDVLLSARRVGPSGMAYGLDMTDEMLALARDNAAKAKATERRVPAGVHRGHPTLGCLGGRGDLQLRDQPLDG